MYSKPLILLNDIIAAVMRNNLAQYMMMLSKHADLLALCGLVIIFPFATETLEPPVETYMTTNEPLLINVLTVSNDGMTQTIMNYHLNNTGFANNFRINILGEYPAQQHILNAASIPDIQHAIDTEIPQSGVRVDYIMYDNEEWDKTPEEEQADPAGSTNKAADMVHAAGYNFGVSPSRQLLLEGLDGINWQKVDLLIIQTQKLVGTPEFKDMTYKVLSTVRSENPHCIVMVQVNPSLNTIGQISDAINSVRNSIDGVSIIWNRDNVRILDDLLTSLKQ